MTSNGAEIVHSSCIPQGRNCWSTGMDISGLRIMTLSVSPE